MRATAAEDKYAAAVEELRWYREQIRSSKEAGLKEVKATFGPGACTSDVIVEKLTAAADEASKTAAKSAQSKADKEKKQAAELEPGYEKLAPSSWSVRQLRAQCLDKNVIAPEKAAGLKKADLCGLVSEIPPSIPQEAARACRPQWG